MRDQAAGSFDFAHSISCKKYDFFRYQFVAEVNVAYELTQRQLSSILFFD